MANVDYFLKIDGIPGESADKSHAGEIDVASWGWSESQAGASAAGGGGGAGKVKMNDFSFTMGTNKASAKLFLACASGQHIKSALLTCRKAGTTQQEYLKITMSDLLVSNYNVTGGPSVLPLEEITLNFSKIQFEYAPQKSDGTLDASSVAGWDLKSNASV